LTLLTLEKNSTNTGAYYSEQRPFLTRISLSDLPSRRFRSGFGFFSASRENVRLAARNHKQKTRHLSLAG